MKTKRYRGYTLVADDVAVDIWFGDQWIGQSPSEAAAREQVDGFLYAP